MDNLGCPQNPHQKPAISAVAVGFLSPKWDFCPQEYNSIYASICDFHLGNLLLAPLPEELFGDV